MSAFMVNHAHVDTMMTAGLTLAGAYGPMRWQAPGLMDDPDYDAVFQRGQPWGPEAIRLSKKYSRELVDATASTVGAMLLAENARSVGHRYDEDELAVELEQAGLYEFSRLGGRPHPVLVLKAISCYEYQACEHPGWRDSEAQVFCDALRDVAIRALPGYDDAPAWEVRDADAWKWRPESDS